MIAERVKLKLVLMNAHRMVGRRYGSSPLWSFVSDLCGLGSHSSVELCKELGWDAHQPAKKQLIYED